MLTQEKLKEYLDYNPDTGIFTWKIASSTNRKAGTVAGSLNSRGYIRIRISGVTYQANVLAWLYVHGVIPTLFVDHINRNPSDNRISNLRLATDSQNAMNAGMNARNTSGFKGVTWNKCAGKWQAKIVANKVNYHLGVFSDIKDAANAARNKALELHGEFSAY